MFDSIRKKLETCTVKFPPTEKDASFFSDPITLAENEYTYHGMKYNIHKIAPTFPSR